MAMAGIVPIIAPPQEDRYILDIQRLEGDLMSFFDVCGRLLGELRLPA